MFPGSDCYGGQVEAKRATWHRQETHEKQQYKYQGKDDTASVIASLILVGLSFDHPTT